MPEHRYACALVIVIPMGHHDTLEPFSRGPSDLANIELPTQAKAWAKLPRPFGPLQSHVICYLLFAICYSAVGRRSSGKSVRQFPTFVFLRPDQETEYAAAGYPR